MEFLKDESIKNNALLADAIAQINDYDFILFLEADVEFVQDGTRNEEIRLQREKYSDRIKEIYDKAGFKYHILSGDYHHRFLSAVKLVDNLLSSSNNYFQ